QPDSLRKLAALAEQIIKNTEGTVNVENPLALNKINLQLTINKEKAAALGVPLVEINRTIRACVAGLPVTSFRDETGDQRDVVLYLPLNDDFSFSDFNRIYVQSLTGHSIPLTQLVTIGLEASPLLISHFNLKRNVTVTADVAGGVSVDRLTKEIVRKLQKAFEGRKVYFEAGGELETRQESFGSMYQAVAMAILAILAVLVLQFRSFLQPLIIFVAIPLSIVGSLLGLLITGYSFSFTAFVGLTSLVGIVVNNSIILVDYTNQLRSRQLALKQAIVQAAKTRLVPIVLTVSTTIGGLLPLTLRGGTLWAPLGWTIIGGLLTSTLLTLIVVPALYK
ncbi:MAG: efflux RND transporter permease subunit, partial [Chloroflexi bacterium]